jgi:hypothetical protein
MSGTTAPSKRGSEGAAGGRAPAYPPSLGRALHAISLNLVPRPRAVSELVKPGNGPLAGMFRPPRRRCIDP